MLFGNIKDKAKPNIALKPHNKLKKNLTFAKIKNAGFVTLNMTA